MNRAAVVIAVKKAGTLPELKAAIEGARRFEAWAKQERFDTVVTITDEHDPVTAGQIKAAIRALVQTDSVEQLFIYFAGHGVNFQYSEFWLLSDAQEDTNEAINVAGSVQLAKRGGIPHVIFISDACRTAPEGILSQSIRGSEIFPNQARGGPQRAIDVFYASLLGEPALEIQDKAASALRYDSLFTAELMAALQGERQAILSRGTDQAKVFLRPQPLKRHLMSAVPKLVASRLGPGSDHTQTPDAEILSDEFAFLQVFDAADPRVQLPAGAAPAPARTVRGGRKRGIQPPTAEPTSSLVQEVLNASPADGHSVIAAVRRSGSKSQIRSFESEVTPFESTLEEIACGFKVRGLTIRSASAAGPAGVELRQPGLAFVDLGTVPAASVLLELANGHAVLLPAVRDFVATLTVEDGVLVNVAYEPSDTARRSDYLFQRDELATLRGLVASSVHRGVFRLERTDAPKLTERIRMLKRLDPTLALYAAYSYHRLGNPEMVREMESFLLADLGVTFFDLAMLADRETTTEPRSVPFVPMLAQGWSLLGAFDAETPVLRKLRPHVLSRSLWTVFAAPAVDTLRGELKGSS